MLRDLARGSEVVIPAWTFGVPLMGNLAKAGVFERGFPPDSGDSVVIDFGDEWVPFNVFRVRDRWQCVEDRDANPRELWLTDADLTAHTLCRGAFYGLMAGELGLSGQVAELQPGIWELGRKRLEHRGLCKVVFAEARVPCEAITLFVAQDPFRSFCVLSAGHCHNIPSVGEKTVVPGLVTVSNGKFTSGVFEDLEASSVPEVEYSGLDLAESPPKLWILGTAYQLPQDRGRPTLGVLYLAGLFEIPWTAISCWDLERKVNKPLETTAPAAMGSDPTLDDPAMTAIRKSIRELEAELAEMRGDPSSSEVEIRDTAKQLDRLRGRLKKDLGQHGKSRLLSAPDKDKARRRVRKALDSVVDAVGKQSEEVADKLRQALGEGAEIYFNPPQNWGI